MYNRTQQPDLSDPRPITNTISVVVADDHPVVRDGVILQLNRHDDITVVGQATTGTEALARSQQLQPTVLLLDVRMPGTQPIALVQQVHALPMPPVILMLSAYDDIEQVMGLLNAGASGYVLKDEPEQQLVAAVRTVASGHRWLSAQIEQGLIDHVVCLPTRSAPPTFTNRERDVLQLLAEGKTHKEIATLLSMSTSTVRFHLDNITVKLGLESRRAVVVWAAQHIASETHSPNTST